jgi:hypothetical protein
MPSWSGKDERQYEHIRDAVLERGRGEEKAQEIAARTVNKRRRLEGRTPSRRTQGSGNPTTRLEQRTRDELYVRASQLGITGRSRMTKTDLIAAIRSR